MAQSERLQLRQVYADKPINGISSRWVHIQAKGFDDDFLDEMNEEVHRFILARLKNEADKAS